MGIAKVLLRPAVVMIGDIHVKAYFLFSVSTLSVHLYIFLSFYLIAVEHVSFALHILFGCLLFVFLFLFFLLSLPDDDVLCKLFSCPLPSVCFPSDRVPELVRFGFVHLVTTGGFVADHLM